MLPSGMLWILRRVCWNRADMTEAAGHADAVRFHEIFREVIRRIFVIALGIPFLGGLFVKGRVGEEAQPDNPGCIAIEGSDRNGLASGADLHAGVFRLIFEGVWRAIRTGNALVEPKSEAVRDLVRWPFQSTAH